MDSNQTTRSKFAKVLGVSPSYITKLANHGRLVFTDDGKKILIAESKARIDETKDPNRDDVGQRHENERNNGETKTNPADEVSSVKFRESRAKKEHYLALKAQVEHERLVGELCDVESARHAGGEVGEIVRSLLENLPDQMSPMLAVETDENRVHALLVESIEQILGDIADKIQAGMVKMIDEQSEY